MATEAMSVVGMSVGGEAGDEGIGSWWKRRQRRWQEGKENNHGRSRG